MASMSRDLMMCETAQRITAITPIQARIAMGISRLRFHLSEELKVAEAVESWRVVEDITHHFFLSILLHVGR